LYTHNEKLSTSGGEAIFWGRNCYLMIDPIWKEKKRGSSVNRPYL